MSELERIPDGVPLENRHAAQIVDLLTGRVPMPATNPLTLVTATGKKLLRVLPSGGTKFAPPDAATKAVQVTKADGVTEIVSSSDTTSQQITNPDTTNKGLWVVKSDGTTEQIRTTDDGVVMNGPVTSNSGATGDVVVKAGRTADYDLWLLCDGRAIPRAGTVTVGGVARSTAALFAEIGTLWGAGNGTTTFNIPDTRDRYLLGADPSNASGRGAIPFASYGGTTTHTHPITDGLHSHTTTHGHGNLTGSAGAHDHGAATGQDGAHDHGGVTGSVDTTFEDIPDQTGAIHLSKQAHVHPINASGTHNHGITASADHGHPIADQAAVSDNRGSNNTNAPGNGFVPYAAFNAFIHL